MKLCDALHTTFAAREYSDRDVSNETLYAVLDLARFAPSGGNRQGWRVIVLRDIEVRHRLRELTSATMKRYVAQAMKGERPWNPIHPSAVNQDDIDAASEPTAVLDPITQAPVVLVAALDLSEVAAFDRDLERVGLVSGASVYPFVWNILLAARGQGLGGTITTFLAPEESAVQQLLGLPSHFALAAVVPLGYPVRNVTRLSRKPVEAFSTIDRFDGAPLESPNPKTTS